MNYDDDDDGPPTIEHENVIHIDDASVWSFTSGIRNGVHNQTIDEKEREENPSQWGEASMISDEVTSTPHPIAQQHPDEMAVLESAIMVISPHEEKDNNEGSVAKGVLENLRTGEQRIGEDTENVKEENQRSLSLPLVGRQMIDGPPGEREEQEADCPKRKQRKGRSTQIKAKTEKKRAPRSVSLSKPRNGRRFGRSVQSNTSQSSLEISSSSSESDGDQQADHQADHQAGIAAVWIRLNNRLQQYGLSSTGIPVLDVDIANVYEIPNGKLKRHDNKEKTLWQNEEELMEMHLSNIDIVKAVNLWDKTVEELQK